MLEVINRDGILVVDSRLVAEALGIQHKTLMETIRNYETEAAFAFGQFTVETETVINSVGAVNEIKYYLLTEDQATFIMTLSRNTEQVVQAKLNLVKAFSTAKQAIITQQQDLSILANLIQELHQKMTTQETHMNVLTERTQRLDEVEQQLDSLHEAAEIHSGCGNVVKAEANKDPDTEVYYSATEYLTLLGFGLENANKLARRASHFRMVGKPGCPPMTNKQGHLVFEKVYLEQAMVSICDMTQLL